MIGTKGTSCRESAGRQLHGPSSSLIATHIVAVDPVGVASGRGKDIDLEHRVVRRDLFERDIRMPSDVCPSRDIFKSSMPSAYSIAVNRVWTYLLIPPPLRCLSALMTCVLGLVMSSGVYSLTGCLWVRFASAVDYVTHMTIPLSLGRPVNLPNLSARSIMASWEHS